MKLGFSCIKCGSKEYEVKNIYLPEKSPGILKVDFGLYYMKVCLECGYCEIYSPKIVDKDDDVAFEY